MGQSNSHHKDVVEYMFSFDEPYGTTVPVGRPHSRRFKHPRAALFNIVFKFLSIVIYLFGGLMNLGFLTTFLLVMLFLSIDFWIVKNVTGSLLVGLRWFNRIDDEGNSQWIYENHNNYDPQNSHAVGMDLGLGKSADATIFWITLAITPLVWSLLLMVSLFRLHVELIVVVVLALVFSLSNLYGYTRCQLGTDDIKTTLTQFVATKVFYNLLEQCDSTFRMNPELYKAP